MGRGLTNVMTRYYGEGRGGVFKNVEKKTFGNICSSSPNYNLTSLDEF